MPTESDNDEILVKLVGRVPPADISQLLRYFPGGDPVLGRCRFIFDHQAEQYDWLVAYDELPPKMDPLACPREHTLLVTTEPATIKVYGSAYLRQFSHILTSHEPFAIDHPGVIRSHPALLWYYGAPMGADAGPARTYDQLANSQLPEKTALISTCTSSKAMGHTLHRMRYDFVQRLSAVMPDLDCFGRGVRAIQDKAEAIDDYKYHVAIENHLAPHHITEKLTDTFLGGALAFYFGAPNAEDYFPKESFIRIDIRKPKEAISVIQEAIAADEYEKRLPAIQEARRRVLDEQNFFAVVSHHVERLDTAKRGGDGTTLIERRAFRKRNPFIAAAYLAERYKVQWLARRAARTCPIY